ARLVDVVLDLVVEVLPPPRFAGFQAAPVVVDLADLQALLVGDQRVVAGPGGGRHFQEDALGRAAVAGGGGGQAVEEQALAGGGGQFQARACAGRIDRQCQGAVQACAGFLVQCRQPGIGAGHPGGGQGACLQGAGTEGVG